MKMIREFRFPVLVLMGCMIIVLFTSYGNKKVHPDLNTLMVEAFLKRNNQGQFSQKDFTKYSFYLEEIGTIKGVAIISNGLFDANDAAAGGFFTNAGLTLEGVSGKTLFYSSEGSASLTPRQWIVTGGFSADVPEVPASLRHFYDPTRAAGDRYLTDITNARIMGFLQKYKFDNPRIDGLKWALGTPGDKSNSPQDHQYTWERGKTWVRMALMETDKDKKNGYMAMAWRSLGETLHMIADHGCPSHVRNDAHPSPLWNNNSWFGNPDPYEEFIDIIRTSNPGAILSFAKGSPDATFKHEVQGYTKAAEIAHALAVFTNTNFVTNETISGIDKYGNARKQITHPDYAYTAPLLNHMSYNDSDHTYEFAGAKQCTDQYYWADLIPKYCDPFVDLNCVKSQAAILIPTLVEAGANVIRLFIPKLAVEIESIDKGTLKGRIRHTPDAEYTDEIQYSGKVTLEIMNNKFKVVDEKDVEAEDGVFETRLKLSKGEKVRAKIEFGGVVVSSDDFEGIETGDIFGLYEGPFKIQFNEADWIEARYQYQIRGLNRNANAEAVANEMKIMKEYSQQQVKAELENMQRNLAALPGGPKAKFSISRTSDMESYFRTSGLKFTVQNLSTHSFIPAALTPLADGSNSGTTLVTSSGGFTVTVVEDETFSYKVTGNFSGNTLNGEWKAVFMGKVIYSATYSARKISD